jgi:excisionase family DNA binding protein
MAEHVVATFVVYPSERDALLGVYGVVCHSVDQAAAILGISDKGVYELHRRGSLLSHARWGKLLLFSRDAVVAAARKRGRMS